MTDKPNFLKNLAPIIMTGVLTGGASTASTWYLQREQFDAQRDAMRQAFQGTLVTENLDQFVAACVTENEDQRTVFMVRLAEAAQCQDGETQACVIDYIRANCRRFVSAAERAAVEEEIALAAQPTPPIEPTAATEEAATVAPSAAATAEPQPATTTAEPAEREERGPRLVMHVASAEARERLRPVNTALQTQEQVEIARGIELVDGYTGPTHVRYYRESDREVALAMIAQLQARLPDIAAEPRLIDVDSDRVAGIIELWVSPDAEVLE